MNIAFKINYLNNPREKHEINLAEGQQFTIGRSECDLNLSDTGVSRQHLRLFIEQRNLIIQDLNSTNGTYHRDKKITTLSVKATDAVRIGPWTIQFEKINEPSSESEPSVEEDNDYVFLRAGKPDLDLALGFYRNAFIHWKTFWLTTRFSNIPAEHSLRVVGGIGLLSGLLSSLYVPVVVVHTIVHIVGCSLAAATLQSLRSFLHLEKGDLPTYLCVTTYTAALALPITQLTRWMGPSGIIVWALFAAWAFWGFHQRFNPDKTRFIIVSIALGLVLLAGASMLLLSVR